VQGLHRYEHYQQLLDVLSNIGLSINLQIAKSCFLKSLEVIRLYEPISVSLFFIHLTLHTYYLLDKEHALNLLMV
jgi:hypothetical protein